MTQLVGYVVGILGCAVLAVYFLRRFLNNKRLRASLWWATGFSLSALGIFVMPVAVSYPHHGVFVTLAFALIASSMAFLYYAASTLFFYGWSFFKEIFTALLFLGSFALFLLLNYLFQKGGLVEVIKSPTMVPFAIVFLVLALAFSIVVKSLHRRQHCRRFEALQSLTLWIVAVWILSVASFWGSIMVVGLVFVLSLCVFMLLYSCRGGEPMEEEYRRFCIQSIDSVEYKVNRKADITRGKLHDVMQEIGNALLYTMKRVDETGVDLLCTTRVIDGRSLEFLQAKGIVDKTDIASFLTTEEVVEADAASRLKAKNPDEASTNLPQEDDKDAMRTPKEIHNEEERKYKMVTYASTIGMIEEELVVHVVELMENISGLARNAYEDPNPYRSGKVNLSRFDGVLGPETDAVDGVPLVSAIGDAGAEFEGTESAVSMKLEKLATLTFFKESTDRDMIETCCELVMSVCDMENDVVTKIKWKGLPDEEHPRGMIGHTYNILRCYDWKIEDEKYTYSRAFRKQFQVTADEYLRKANSLREDAFEFRTALPDAPDVNHTEAAIGYLRSALALLQEASDLIEEASTFPKNPPGL